MQTMYTKQTNFEKVVDFNKQFGVKTYDSPQHNILERDPNVTESCIKLIREEMCELEDAVKNQDFRETTDALLDILYVVYGMGCRIGLDMNTLFDEVHENNMSKLCKSESEAIDTVEYYVKNKEKLRYDSPTYRQAPDLVHWVVYNKSTNKVLKSINWKPVNLSI